MTGFGTRDRAQPCNAIHDDIHVRALYLRDGDRQALVAGFDLLFFSRDEADRFRGAIGRRLDLRPSEVLLNTSHSHSGPKVGSWLYDPPSDLLYLQELEHRTLSSAVRARDAAVDVTLWAGTTRSALPMNRRLTLPTGKVDRTMRPNPEGPVCDLLPVCLLKSADGDPVCLLFSASCHPSTIHATEISAEYPGVACGLLDSHLGKVASLFLQGTGGDAKPSVIADGERWRSGTWEDVGSAGELVADEVRALLPDLKPVEPDLRACALESLWPVESVPDRAGFEAIRDDPAADRTTVLWAEEKLAILGRGYTLPAAVPVTVHGLQLGKGLRIVGLEGEAVADLGLLILDSYGGGVTFPLGYTNGAQAYLPSDRMLEEGGYEVVSFHEYRMPARFVADIDRRLSSAIGKLRRSGID